MIPDREMLYTEGAQAAVQPGLTYAIDMERENGSFYDEGAISGTCDGIAAVKQAVYKVLRTEFGRHRIYGSYGSEHFTLFGKPAPFVIPELERMITEALKRDDRVENVDGFEFEEERGKVSARFTVHTIYGDFSEVIDNV